MSKWADKTVIGLTGNIGTGKSVVRKMLEHLGAYGIDADALGHRAIAKGAPGYQPVLDIFGTYILAPDGQIDRKKLGRLVFSDPEALSRLERIVHPLVRQAVDFLVRRSSQPVVVIEAIKLLESTISKDCDSIWVVTVPPQVQLARLMEKRGMSEADARQRINAQPPQIEKIRAANVVISNDKAFENTWKQVLDGWRKVVQVSDVEPVTRPIARESTLQGEIRVERGRPRQSAEIATLINRLRPSSKPLAASDIMAAFGEKAFLLLSMDGVLRGAVGWQVENLIARTTDIVLEIGLPLDKAMRALMNEVEAASRDLQCEASLMFVPPELAGHEALWKELGYVRSVPEGLEVLAWQDAARESMPDGTILFFKKLRADRVLRPI